jgi:hypothetical protein
MQTPTAVNSNQTARSAPYAASNFALSTCHWEVSAYEATHQILTKSAQTAPANSTRRSATPDKRRSGLIPPKPLSVMVETHQSSPFRPRLNTRPRKHEPLSSAITAQFSSVVPGVISLSRFVRDVGNKSPPRILVFLSLVPSTASSIFSQLSHVGFQKSACAFNLWGSRSRPVPLTWEIGAPG